MVWKVITGHLFKCTLLPNIQTDKGSDPETIDTGTIPSRYEAIVQNKTLLLNGQRRIEFNMERDMVWRWDLVLKTHSNGMRFSVFDENGDMLATNEYFSVGGGFVVNDKTKGNLCLVPEEGITDAYGLKSTKTCSTRASIRRGYMAPGCSSPLSKCQRCQSQEHPLSSLILTIRQPITRSRPILLTLLLPFSLSPINTT